MRLYIAEKPSMGREIAKCLRGPTRAGDGFIETAEGVVTWCFGHILRQAEPEEYDAAYKKWTESVLPIVPATWKLIVSESSAKQFSIVKALIAKADEIVHAGDPDREGQLLVDEVLDFVGNKKPVRRLLLNALDEKSVKEALADLRDNRDFAPLKMSALARARADWLIGMNLSRAYTLAARRAGRKTVLPIGRVKTPTLALVVRREREIANFHPVKHYTIKAEFSHKNGNFTATWKPLEEQRGLDSEGRLIDKNVAEEKLASFSAAKDAGETGVVTDYKKNKKEEPQRLPFALSTLQVLAGKRFGYEPQQVLDTAQQLYERKLTTYPRSDCEYLPTNQFRAAGTILTNLTQTGDNQLAAWAGGANAKTKSRAWNDKKITAHHAIIPTTVKVKLDTLTPMQRNIYFLIAQAYLAQFYPVHVYDQTKLELNFAGERFTSSGRVVREVGWKSIYASQNVEKNEGEETDENNDSGELPAMKKKDVVAWQVGKLSEKETKPPQRFTPSTLLAAMKDIHKFVRDDTAKKTLRAVSGIGTEATRATIIDDLIRRNFLQAAGKKKVLTPTSAAEFLVDALPEDMTYPDKTAVWEDALHAMAEGEGSIDLFLEEQIAFTRSLCGMALKAVLPPAEEETRCPRCGRGVLTQKQGKNGVFWGCTNFPRCRMTAPDANGKPDLSRISARRESGSQVISSDDFRASKRPAAPAASPASWQDGAPGLSEEEMAAFFAEYQPTLSVSSYGGANSTRKKTWRGDKPKYSAAPMERMEKKSNKSNFLCPHCKEGFLRFIRGKNGGFWGCTNYPSCTATYDDANGKPVLP